ncbi:MAG: hypothetical protein LVQ97_01830 [Candidatus Micrarchaeales archaeon]|jgi:hypothetical protein|nr:hypothetical protein [Candidatus Micrarchaeales archaeon]
MNFDRSGNYHSLEKAYPATPKSRTPLIIPRAASLSSLLIPDWPIDLTSKPNYKTLSLNDGANARLIFLVALSLVTKASNDETTNQQKQILMQTSKEQFQILPLLSPNIAEYLKLLNSKKIWILY